MLQYKVFIGYYKTTTYFGSIEIQEHIKPNLCAAIASELHDLSDKTVETAYPLLFLVPTQCDCIVWSQRTTYYYRTVKIGRGRCVH